MVLAAFDTLIAEGVNDCLFIVDCDGGTDPIWLGRKGLIISSNRDVDADLLFSVGAFDRVALEFFAHLRDSPEECIATGNNLLDYAKEISSSLGIVLDSARGVGVVTNHFDPVVNSRRRMRLKDLPEFPFWLGHFVPITPLDLVPAISELLEWSTDEVRRVSEVVIAGATKFCRKHGVAKCQTCTPRRFSNGHDLVDVLALGVSQRCGYEVSEAEVARAVRLAASPEAIGSWDVAIRIGRWLSTREES
ncbi:MULTISPECIES: hypothetical protein [unclassified Rathayibacter]|uniref:hypothetical protein n=1 Tax=unclassified Rathayibacter TaxID=2609250 RepID=UPI0011B01045|nr:MULTISPECIES: hypothetical protein [unclassified Rathayibacter]